MKLILRTGSFYFNLHCVTMLPLLPVQQYGTRAATSHILIPQVLWPRCAGRLHLHVCCTPAAVTAAITSQLSVFRYRQWPPHVLLLLLLPLSLPGPEGGGQAAENVPAAHKVTGVPGTGATGGIAPQLTVCQEVLCGDVCGNRTTAYQCSRATVTEGWSISKSKRHSEHTGCPISSFTIQRMTI